MIDYLITLKDTIKPFQNTITSAGAAVTGSLLGMFNIYLQMGAYLVAILAGLVAIYNGTRGWHRNSKDSLK